jgi:hypothetical protein
MKHGHGNDGLAMPASVAHRGMDLFDHRHGWEERNDGHQHHQSPANAPDPPDGLIAVIGGSSDLPGIGPFIQPRRRRGRCRHFSRCVGRRFHHRAGSRAIEAWLPRCVGALGARLPGDRHSWLVGETWPDRHRAGSALRSPSAVGQEPLPGNLAQVFAMAEAHGANTLSATFANALTVENHFSLVNAMAMVAL